MHSPFTLPVVLARVFTREQFGIYKQAFLVVMTTSAILPLNFGMSAFYFLPRETTRKPSIVLNVLIAFAVAGVIGGGAVAFIPGSLHLVLGDTSLSSISQLVGLVVFLWIFSGLAESLATANQDVRYSTIFIVGVQFTKTALLAAAALIFRTVEAVLWAAVFQGLLQSSLLLWYSSHRFGAWWHAFDKRLLKEQLFYVLLFGISAILWKLQMDLHSFLIANKFSAADFAIYSVGVSQLPLVALFRESVNSVLLARMSSLQHGNRTQDMVRLFFTAMRKLGLAYLPAFAILMVLGRELIIVMYTRAYEASWPIFALNLLILLTSIISVDAILRAYAEWRFFLVKLRIGLIVLVIGTSLVAIPRFGMIGAISALVFVLVIERIVLALVVVKILHITGRDWVAAMPVLRLAGAAAAAAAGASIVRLACLHFGPAVTVLAAGSTFVVIYAGLVLSLGLLDDAEQAVVRRVTSPFMKRFARSV